MGDDSVGRRRPRRRFSAVTPAGAPAPHPLNDRIASALLWLAAFSFAAGVFFSLTLWFAVLPPVKPVAVGVVTIEHYSKLRDYLGAALFMTLVPALTVWFRRIGERLANREGHPIAFALPFLLSPLFYLTTGKVGWILILPVALAFAATRTMRIATESAWLRRIFAGELHPFHALLFSEAMGWVIFRYIVTGRRIAHFRTLFLEIVFVALFLALFWCAALLVARVAEVSFGAGPEMMFRRMTTAGLPLVALPLVGLIWSPTPFAWGAVIVAFLIVALLAMRIRPLSPRAAWAVAAYVTIPILLYFVSYASSAHLSQWIDLFHRGESIGPASDYLRGKVPYRGVFALHGMLEDGLLDAWLMQLFGRSLGVAIARQAILGAFLGVSIWYLGIVIFESIPLALIVTAMGAWTTAESDRTFFQVAAVALFWHALRRRNRFSAVASGVFAAIALFFSYEIGLYTITGAIASAVVLWGAGALAGANADDDRGAPLRTMLWFVIGVVIGAAPFVAYLVSRGALGDFASVSFVTIPRIIDAVWSLPFPDLVSTFRSDLNLHTLSDFVLFEKFHLILSPLAIAIAAAYYIQRVVRRRADTLDHALAVLTVFCAIAQRTAFGRAEFRHQYFAAFLTGPILVLLAIFFVRRLRIIWSEGERPFIAALVIAALPVIGVVFWIPDLINARIDDVINYQRRVINVIVDPRAGEVQARIEQVTNEIRALARPGEPIFDFSNQPAFYFFADRPNPTRFYQVPIASPREFQSEVIAALERTKPKVIIRTSPERYDEFDGIPNAMRAQAVAAYIDDCYRFAKSVRGVELWTRLPNARPAQLATYLWRIHIPDEKELALTQRERIVFPVIGSVWGANGAHWVSDLTLHNPLREPIDVSLRYNAVDRQLRLAPRQTIRWPDVVHNLFLQPDGIGALWLVHRAGRVPVALLQTSDVAHGGRVSIETPLGARDAATADTGNAELTIAGIPTIAQRRVNVGVVNTGIIPATFRITARAPNGKAIGKPVESGIPEDQVWLTNDIERELGVKIDENTTLRITAVAGSGVAFATIVDGLTGDTAFIAATPSQQ